MKRFAKEFLFGKVADPFIIGRPPPYLETLPEPEYIAVLRAALEAKGVMSVHINGTLGTNATPSAIEKWRIYWVRSFVWMGKVYIIRNNFNEDIFAQWPYNLQTIWLETEIEV